MERRCLIGSGSVTLNRAVRVRTAVRSRPMVAEARTPCPTTSPTTRPVARWTAGSRRTSLRPRRSRCPRADTGRPAPPPRAGAADPAAGCAGARSSGAGPASSSTPTRWPSRCRITTFRLPPGGASASAAASPTSRAPTGLPMTLRAVSEQLLGAGRPAGDVLLRVKRGCGDVHGAAQLGCPLNRQSCDVAPSLLIPRTNKGDCGQFDQHSQARSLVWEPQNHCGSSGAGPLADPAHRRAPASESPGPWPPRPVRRVPENRTPGAAVRRADSPVRVRVTRR